MRPVKSEVEIPDKVLKKQKQCQSDSNISTYITKPRNYSLSKRFLEGLIQSNLDLLCKKSR